jgi:hypothetical protein
MKKSLFWSLIAATAMMTACGDDAFVDNQQVVTGEETPVAFKINMGNAISTYAGTDFSKGGWSNWKDSDTKMIDAVNVRATLQIFANGGTAPYTQVRTVLTEAPGGNDIDLPEFRLAAGNSYTAVVWVDFVPKSVTSSSTENRNDYYWKTENLANVSELEFTEGMMPIIETPEARDAYTGLIKFTVNADGTYNIAEGTENNSITTAIPITATRKFAKISLILTDYDNKTEWADALNNIGEENILEYLGMEVTNLSTGYNALTQTPVSATPTTKNYFHRPFDVASATSTSDDVNGVKWHKDGDKYYPIFDLNYVIPEKAGKDATYSLSFKGYNVDQLVATEFTKAAAELTTINEVADGLKLVAVRNASNVPVRTNAHTIIKMNLYKAYSCTVTIVDEFTGGTETVEITDDDKKQSTDDHFIPEGDVNGAHVVVVRGDDGKAISIDITGINKDNFDQVIDDLVAMKNLSSAADETKPVINMSGTDIPNPADFSDLTGNVTNDIKLTLTKDGQDIILEGLSNNITLDLPSIQKFEVTSTADVTIEKVVSNGWPTTIKAKNVTFAGTTYNSVAITVEKTATFNGGEYNSTVTVIGSEDTAKAVISGGTFKDFNSSVNTTVNGGSLPYVDNDGNGVADYKLTMKNGKTLTIKKTGTVFGPLFADSGADCKLVYDSQDIKNLYSGYEGSNWSNISVAVY